MGRDTHGYSMRGAPPPSVKDIIMEHPIKQQLREDLRLAGLAESSRASYLEAVDLFFKRTWLAPEEVAPEDLAAYFKCLLDADAAQGTFKVARHALVFLFSNTLRRDWPLFKKSCAPQDRKGFPKHCPTRNA
jgi:hypothetical protein